MSTRQLLVLLEASHLFLAYVFCFGAAQFVFGFNRDELSIWGELVAGLILFVVLMALEGVRMKFKMAWEWDK